MGTKSRDLQLDSVQGVKDLGALSPKREVSIISLHSVLREFCRRGGKSRLRARWMEDRKQGLLNTDKLTESVAACTRPG